MARLFLFFVGDAQIGTSELEWYDQSNSICGGLFVPSDGYKQYEALFQELSYILFNDNGSKFGSQTAQEAARVDVREEELKSCIGNFDIRLHTANGEHIPTAFIRIVDYAPDLGDDGREITVCVEDWDVYVQFFGQQR